MARKEIRQQIGPLKKINAELRRCGWWSRVNCTERSWSGYGDSRRPRRGQLRHDGDEAVANQLTTRNQRRRSVPSFTEARPDRTPRPFWGSQFGRFGPHPRASTPNCGPGSPKRSYNRTQRARRWNWRGSDEKCRIMEGRRKAVQDRTVGGPMDLSPINPDARKLEDEFFAQENRRLLERRVKPILS